MINKHISQKVKRQAPIPIENSISCHNFQIVIMLNTMFAIFDHLTDRNSIYKVETVKDTFVGVSGAPERVGCLTWNSTLASLVNEFTGIGQIMVEGTLRM